MVSNLQVNKTKIPLTGVSDMKALMVIPLIAALLIAAAAFDVPAACLTLARGFFPVAVVVFVVTSALGLVTRFRP